MNSLSSVRKAEKTEVWEFEKSEILEILKKHIGVTGSDFRIYAMEGGRSYESPFISIRRTTEL